VPVAGAAAAAADRLADGQLDHPLDPGTLAARLDPGRLPLPSGPCSPSRGRQATASPTTPLLLLQTVMDLVCQQP
jgi:hypothetical protein